MRELRYVFVLICTLSITIEQWSSLLQMILSLVSGLLIISPFFLFVGFTTLLGSGTGWRSLRHYRNTADCWGSEDRLLNPSVVFYRWWAESPFTTVLGFLWLEPPAIVLGVLGSPVHLQIFPSPNKNKKGESGKPLQVSHRVRPSGKWSIGTPPPGSVIDPFFSETGLSVVGGQSLVGGLYLSCSLHKTRDPTLKMYYKNSERKRSISSTSWLRWTHCGKTRGAARGSCVS